MPRPVPSKPKKVSKVASAFNGDSDDDDVVVAAPAKSAVSQGAKDVIHEERVWIVLEDSLGIPPTGQYIAVNGRNWMLKTGVPVSVPRALLNVLDDAVESVPLRDPDSNRIIDYRDKQRFPYRIVKAPRDVQAA